MATAKPKLKYRIVNGTNPKTKERLFRPVLAERETLYIDQLVQYALKAGFVRGQFHDMRGALNGFIEAIQELGRNGKAIVLNDWLRISGTLSGSVGEDGALTEKNAYHVRIRALKELKRRADEFTWTMVGGVPGTVTDGAADGTAG